MVQMQPGQMPPLGGVPAQGLLPPNAQYQPRMRQRAPGPAWQQPRHPQEVTLQQRGAPMPPGVLMQPGGVMQPSTSGVPQQHPALARQEPTPPPPPPPLAMTPPPPPPDNPVTEEDRMKVARYESWLKQQEQSISAQQNYYEKEISKLRKTRKVSDEGHELASHH